MKLSDKIEFIARDNASGLYDKGLDFQTAYKMQLEYVSQWNEDEIESEYKLRNEYFEGGGIDGNKIKPL
ncbi:TPA: hypothetical protein ACGO1T_001761 [Streptococcus suis]